MDNEPGASCMVWKFKKNEKEVLKKLSKEEATFPGLWQRYIQKEMTGRIPNVQSENNLRIKIYKAVLDFNPTCKNDTMIPYWETEIIS